MDITRTQIVKRIEELETERRKGLVEIAPMQRQIATIEGGILAYQELLSSVDAYAKRAQEAQEDQDASNVVPFQSPNTVKESE